jgi:hypothetical protein
MKKKIISIIGLALFVGAIAFNLQMNSGNNDQLSDVTLKNIEAMAAPGGEDDDGDSDCEMSVTCGTTVCVVMHAKNRFLARGCKKKCDYTCTVQSTDIPDLI